MKIVYISGPVVGNANAKNVKQVVRRNINEAKKYARILAKHDIGFFLPHLHTIDVRGWDITQKQRYHYILDATILMRLADAFIFVPGWENSHGATLEHEIAGMYETRPKFYPKAPTEEGLADVVRWCEESGNAKLDDKIADDDITSEELMKIKRALAKLANYSFEDSAFQSVA